MSKKKIYLSGAISGIPYEEASKWRMDISRSFVVDNEVSTFDPTAHFTENDVDSGVVSNLDIMNAELFQLKNSDIVVINLEHPESIGSLIEIAIAYERHIPIFGLNEKSKKLHPWVELMITKEFSNMEELVMYVEDHYLNYY